MVSLNEHVVSPTEATRLCPGRRKGKKPNVATIYRWMTVGCKGIILESLQVGGTRCTSREALQRFFDRLTAQAAGSPPPAPAPRVDRRAVAQAERVLDRAGI